MTPKAIEPKAAKKKELKTEKLLRNVKVFAPKRRYNVPRYDEAIKPNRTKIITNGLFTMEIKNVSNKMIYVRAE